MADIAESLRKDLGADVPFIVGEVSYHIPNSAVINPYIRDISYVVPDSGWVSAEGCNANRDSIHFSRQGVTLLGERYAEKVLEMVYGQDIYAEEDSTVTAPEGMYTISDFDRTVVDFDGEKTYSNFMLHYNFPPYSVGECGRLTTGRREIGHGHLAQRALEAVVPKKDKLSNAGHQHSNTSITTYLLFIIFSLLCFTGSIISCDQKTTFTQKK